MKLVLASKSAVIVQIVFLKSQMMNSLKNLRKSSLL